MPRQEGIRAVFSMVIGGIVAAVAAFVYLSQVPDMYQARALLYYNTLKELQENTSYPPLLLDFFPQIVMPDIQAILTCDEMAESVRAYLAENGMGEVPRSRGAVRSAMGVNTRLYLQTTSQALYQSTLELTFSAGAPETAAAAVNFWAHRSVEKFAATQGAIKSRILRAIETRLEALEGEQKKNAATAGNESYFMDATEALRRNLREAREYLLLVTEADLPSLTIVSEALPPEAPAAPKRSLTLAAAAVVGMFVGLVFHVLRQALNLGKMP
jgi:hypothetical protein